jgi:four helix bundle protein
MGTTNYRDLVAWQKAMGLVESVYRATRGFPREEVYGLTAQLRRAAVSIPSNIAEGQGRRSARDFLHFLSMAYGSLREVETQILIAERLQYLDAKQRTVIVDEASEVGRLINGLTRAVEKQSSK